MEKLFKFVMENVASGKIDKQTGVQMLKIIKTEGIKTVEDIAIIGIAARFPWADSADEMWDMVANGFDCIHKLPEERCEDLNRYLRYLKTPENYMKYLDGAYLKQIDEFDYRFFRMSPRDASLMDPPQRIFFQTLYHAIEDAGYGGKKLVGSNTGIYVGYAGSNNYQRMIEDVDPASLPVASVGNINAMAPSRMSYFLDLKGPTMVLDSACSASLVAVHLACQALKVGDCDMAIAGGIRLNLIPLNNDYMKVGFESSDYRTRAFDDSANGAGMGEGMAAVLLKPLSRAIADGDNMYAVIKGSAINQDGTSIGITAPNPVSQTNVLLKAWENAGINPERLAYIEAHGTGTNLGDPLEIDAIEKAFKKYTTKKQFCAISSLKTNMGHLYECAGLAGLIKAVMALKNKKIPPQIHFNKPNRKIDFGNTPLYVNTGVRDWNSDGLRLCGVSGFGLSGTNCHIVLEEAPEKISGINIKNTGPFFMTISARTKEGIGKLIERYYEFIKNDPEADMERISYTANTGRGHYTNRLILVVKDLNDLEDRLESLMEDGFAERKGPGIFYGEYRMVGENKAELSPGEINEREKIELNKRLENLTDGFMANEGNSNEMLSEMCSLYIKGADFNWDKLYKDRKIIKMSLPVYPFENVRCWIDIPEKENVNTEEAEAESIYYSMYWRENQYKGEESEIQGPVLVFMDEESLGLEICDKLSGMGIEVIEVSHGEGYKKTGDLKYEISFEEESYFKLLSELKSNEPLKIIHLFTADSVKEINNVSELEEYRKKGVFSLLALTRALAGNGYTKPIDILLVSRNVDQVTGRESFICPQNAMMPGLGKVVRREYLNLLVRSMDIDESTGPDHIISELKSLSGDKTVAYREGKRFVEEFGTMSISNSEDSNIQIRENGVYVITGGLGGIGLEVAKWISSQNKVKLALINRFKMPAREDWEKVLQDNKDGKLVKRINAIRELESKGCDVSYYSGDVSSMEAMEEIIDDIRNKLGKINGVIHGSGVSQNDLLERKNEEGFNNVMRSKVQGTWILDKLLEEDNLDFLVLFSSVATIFSAASQGDYAAANAYLDAYTSYRNRKGKRTLTINWPAWKEVGMAADSGFTIDTIFIALPTNTGIEGLEQLLKKKIKRALVGELNLSTGGINLIERSGISLTSGLKSIIEKNRKHVEKINVLPKSSGNSEIVITGRENGEYSHREKVIAEIWCRELGLGEIGIYEDFLDLGGDSIVGVSIANGINEKLDVKIDAVALLKYPTVIELAGYIDENFKSGQEASTAETYPAVEAAGKMDAYPVSPIQRGLVMLNYLEGIGTSYNLPAIEVIQGNFDLKRCEETFEKLIERHESLRTSFAFENDRPVQKIHDKVEFRINYMEIDEKDLKNSISTLEGLIKPFDLEKPPLLRVNLVKIAQDRYLMIYDIHHIITDGISNQILISEFEKIYQGESLEPIGIQYKDYSVWFEKLMDTDFMKKQEKFWLDRLKGDLPVLNLPVDHQRPAVQSFEGGHLYFELDSETTEKLRLLSQETGATLYMLLLALLNTLFYKYTGQEDIIIGSPSAGRLLPEFENILGMFVNTLAMRNYPTGKIPFREFLKSVRENALDVYVNQYYPFTYLVEKLAMRRDLSRNPVFDVMFVLQNYEIKRSGIEGISGADIDIDLQLDNYSSKFDLSVAAIEKEDRIGFDFEYCARLFKLDTVKRLFVHFKNVIKRVIENPDIRLSEIDMLSEEERIQLVYEFNDNSVKFDENLLAHQLFERHAEKTPLKTAILYEGRECSYEEINEKANQIAWFLKRTGVKAGEPVAIMIDREPLFAITVLGIWKAGGAYIPIDPEYPGQRILSILEEAGPRFLITKSGHVTPLITGNFDGTIIKLDKSIEEIAGESCHNLNLDISPRELAYVIYTSGSTGVPKGAMIEHLGMINHIHAEIKELEITDDSIIAQNAPQCFDISVWQFFAALSAGGQIVIYPNNVVLDVGLFTDRLIKDGVTILEAVPTFLGAMMEYMEDSGKRLYNLEYLLATGETVSRSRVKKWFELNPGTKVVNAYGPAEASDDISQFTMDSVPESESISIGKPLQNISIYIADKDMNLCPVGVKGEICVSGICVGRGYLNNPAKTKEVFMNDPFIGKDGVRLYKTGDNGFWMPDGNLQFMGRTDYQVKIRGYRIETGDVRAKLLSVGSVREAEVVAKTINNSLCLCAYYVADGEISPEDIRQHLVNILPGYMIPSFFVRLEKVPLSPNGKIDLKALPEPVAMDRTNLDSDASNRTHEKLIKIWEEVLNTGKIGIEDNFFDLGGDSIKAIRIVSKMSLEFSVTVNDIFMNPTVKELSNKITYNEKHLRERIESVKKSSSLPNALKDKDNGEVQNKIDQYLNKIKEYEKINLKPVKHYKNILLAGATGFLGSHLAMRLLSTTDANITLITRGKDDADARERVIKRLEYYFGPEFFIPFESRVKVLNGDISMDNLGIDRERYLDLAENVDCVINSAAIVKHYGLYDSFHSVNVKGTGNLLDFCKTQRIKDYNHISTTSVAGGVIQDKDYCLFTEYDLDVGQKDESMYVSTKFEAEKLVFAARSSGLNVNVFRPGNLVFDTSTGIFQENINDSAFYTLLKDGIKLGVIPDSEKINIDFSFIDYTARAIVLLFNRTNLRNETYHIANPAKANIAELGEMITNSGYAVKVISLPDFLDYIYENYYNGAMKVYVDEVLMRTGILEEDKPSTEFDLRQDKTDYLLKRLDFTWDRLDGGHVESMIRHCEKVGFI